MEPEDAAQADGHIAVAGKIEIEVQHIGRRVQPDEQHGSLCAAFISGDQLEEDIGQQHLFGKAEDEAACAAGGVTQGMSAAFQLGGNVGVPDDGTGDELGEHGHISGKVDKIPLGGHIAPVHVNDVA